MALLVLPPKFVPTLSTIINWVMTFTPLLSYGTTVLSIRKKQSSKGFSIDICATMLLASTLRIFYYFNDPFEISLLRQCFVMIFIQTILLYNALKFRPAESESLERFDNQWSEVSDIFMDINDTRLRQDYRNYCLDLNGESLEQPEYTKQILILIFNWWRNNAMLLGLLFYKVYLNVLNLFDAHYIRPFHFWQWHHAKTYWMFLGGFLTCLSGLQVILHGKPHFGFILGSASFLIESSLPLPQILLFQRLQTVENFKTILLLSWLAGDFTKISYLLYGTNNVGPIFIVAALFQMSLNLVITFLFFKYKRMDIERHEGILPITLKSIQHTTSIHDLMLNNLANEAPSSRVSSSSRRISSLPVPFPTEVKEEEASSVRSRSSTVNQFTSRPSTRRSLGSIIDTPVES